MTTPCQTVGGRCSMRMVAGHSTILHPQLLSSYCFWFICTASSLFWVCCCDIQQCHSATSETGWAVSEKAVEFWLQNWIRPRFISMIVTQKPRHQNAWGMIKMSRWVLVERLATWGAGVKIGWQVRIDEDKYSERDHPTPRIPNSYYSCSSVRPSQKASSGDISGTKPGIIDSLVSKQP